MLTPERLERLRKELEEERDRLSEELERLDADQFGDGQGDINAGVGNHPAEDALITFTQEQMLALQRNHRILLEEVEWALRRMDRGIYGQCERCGREIDFARLKARPSARYCMECQRLVEYSAEEPGR